jgi:hypothetical protein
MWPCTRTPIMLGELVCAVYTLICGVGDVQPKYALS